MRLGVLAVQGDVAENVSALRAAARRAGSESAPVEAKTAAQVKGLDGLVIPGGESTAMGAVSGDILDAIRERASAGMPVLGICAGMVMMAGRASDRVVGGTSQKLLGLLDVQLERNSFGRQRDSFEADVEMKAIGIPRFRGVFIRAPAVTSVSGGAEAVAKVGEKVVAVKKGNLLGVSFHPELTGDLAVHRYFAGLASAK